MFWVLTALAALLILWVFGFAKKKWQIVVGGIVICVLIIASYQVKYQEGMPLHGKTSTERK